MEMRPPFLLLNIVYDDDDLIEFESRLIAGDCAGKFRAYASAMSAQKNAESLARWVPKPDSPFVVELGDNTVNGWVCLRFRRVDRAGHIVCYMQLADMATSLWADEGVNRLAIRMQVEPGHIERFARELKAAAGTRRGEALLQGRSTTD